MKEHQDKLRALSANDNLAGEHYDKYKRYLDDALSEDNQRKIKNIAITGKYGSGKSSIIDTYFKDNDAYLRVSFATFDSDEKSKGINNKESNNSESDKVIKNDGGPNIFANIINQIIYQLDVNKIPLTKFKVKKPLSKDTKVGLIIELALISTLFVHFGLGMSKYVISIRLIIIFALGLAIVWKALSKFEINRLKLSFKLVDTEIDMGRDDLFERYTDEIIYLFENSGKSILIIEDLDRFNDLKIFEKLRELNTKLNYTSKTNWRFIYLIKDDLFVNKNDRVKFFDEIIPVIPFITSNNSFDKLRDLFEGDGIDIKLLRILGVYIDDFRILLNISNEYKVYFGAAENQNKNELLALIAYKNLFPTEFDDLQNGKGKLAKIVNESNQNIRDQIQKLNEQREELKLKKETVAATNEVEFLTLWSMNNGLDFYQSGRGGYNNVPNLSISNIAHAKQVIEQDLQIGSLNQQNAPKYSEYKQANADYADGLAVVTSFDGHIVEISNKIEQLSELKLKDVDRNAIEGEFSDILFALIKYGFITGDYLNVINHYYGDQNNLVFMKRIFAGLEKDKFDLKITDLAGLNENLDDTDFDKNEILNFDLFNWLYSTNNDKRLTQMIKTANHGENTFIEEAINLNPELFDAVLKVLPNIHFDLTKLLEINVNKIILENLYDDTKSNGNILVGWISNWNQGQYIELLNNETVYGHLKKAVIENLLNKLELNQVSHKDLWTNILHNHKAIVDENNVIIYFDEFGIDINLINFINEDNIEFKGNLSQEFFDDVIAVNEINDDKFSEIWASYQFDKKYSVEDIMDQEINKLSLLLSYGVLTMTQQMIEYIVSQKIELPKIYNNHNFKNFVLENKIKLNDILVKDLLKQDDEYNEQIFMRSIPALTKSTMIDYVEKNILFDGKILKIMNHHRGAQNLKVDETEMSIKLFKWMQENGYIESYDVLQGKMKPNFKKKN
ncbi:MAG: hypothetical protein LBT37_04385 [Lactobacillaceae bacterium]|jgi:hypothetical protein|nr:hypothetical protein [Lactobacillaceae bacterium]